MICCINTWGSAAKTSLKPTGSFGFCGSGKTGSIAAKGGNESVHNVGATAVVLTVLPGVTVSAT